MHLLTIIRLVVVMQTPGCPPFSVYAASVLSRDPSLPVETRAAGIRRYQ
jgi:hypothetical protein